jgi:hypothetical protein
MAGSENRGGFDAETAANPVSGHGQKILTLQGTEIAGEKPRIVILYCENI